MKVNVRLPVDSEIDPDRLQKAIAWALQEPGSPEKIWRLNEVPAIAQIEEAVFLDGRQGLAELYHDVVKGLGLPQHGEALAVLQKALDTKEEA